jgi:hypothetical protein
MVSSGTTSEIRDGISSSSEDAATRDRVATIVTDTESGAPAALSCAEEQLWLALRPNGPGIPFFDCSTSVSLVVRIENVLNSPALKASLDHIVRRHAVLRSRFVVRDGRPFRLLRHADAAQLTTIDVSRISEAERPALVHEALRRHVNDAFDLTRGPLFRTLLVVLAEDHFVLAIVAHHLVFDRWSKRVLARELQLLYAAYAIGRRPEPERLDVGYDAYVRWQRRELASPADRELVAHWMAALSGMRGLTLFDDRPGRLSASRAGEVRFTIPVADTGRLEAMSRQVRATPATVMLAVFTLVLSRMSGQRDIAIGMPLADRRRPEFEALIGLFANVVVVRTTVVDDASFLGLLASVRRAVVEACRHQDLPYGRLLETVGARTPLYRATYNFLPRIPASQVELEGLRVTPLHVPAQHRARTDLNLHVWLDRGALEGHFVFPADRVTVDQVRTIAAQLQRLVKDAMDDPHQVVGRFDVTPCRAGERR